MQDYDSFLSQAILLEDINPKDILAYIKKGQFKIKSYNKNTVIHFEGESCCKLEIILLGEVVVERLDESGGLLTIATFTNNDILGGNLLFSKEHCFPMTITTTQPTTIVEIEKEFLFQLFVENPLFLRRYLEYVSDQVSILGYKLKHYVNKTIRESLLSLLKYENKKRNTNRIVLNMTKKALAEKIGVQRTSLSRELTKMKKDGLILFDSESITIITDKH